MPQRMMAERRLANEVPLSVWIGWGRFSFAQWQDKFMNKVVKPAIERIKLVFFIYCS